MFFSEFFSNMSAEYVRKKTEELARKHGVDPEKVVLHECQQGSFLRWTLLYAVDDIPAESKPAPYPFEFAKDFEKTLASKQGRAWRRAGGKFEFVDGGRITPAEIGRRQRAFSAHCDLFHLND